MKKILYLQLLAAGCTASPVDPPPTCKHYYEESHFYRADTSWTVTMDYGILCDSILTRAQQEVAKYDTLFRSCDSPLTYERRYYIFK